MSVFGRKAIEIGDIGALSCPDCGEQYLHQQNTTIFQRGEDGDITTVIAQDGNKVQATDFPNADTCNPSSRRHGLIIEFECEFCHHKELNNLPLHRLAILQHKGNTFVEWL
jgi:hypothetical protein